MQVKSKIGWEHILVVIVIVIGMAARLWEANYSFSADEVFSIKLANHQFSEVISASLADRTHPPLHNILLHIWIRVFGNSEASAHMLSVLFSLAFMVLSYALLRKFVDWWIALGLLAILALSPHFVYYGQEARPYALIALLVTANLLAFLRLLDATSDRIRIAIWITSSILLLYAQHLGIFIVGLEMMFALALLQSDRKKIFLYGCIAVTIYLPWLIEQMWYPFIKGTKVLSEVAWIRRVHFDGFISFYLSPLVGDLDSNFQWWILAIIVPLVLAYVKYFVTNKKRPPDGHMILFLIAFGMPVIAFCASKWGPQPVFVWRQLIGSAAAFVYVIGLCLTVIPRKLAAGILLISLLLTTMSLPKDLPHNINPPWRDMAQGIDHQYGSIAVVTLLPWAWEPLDHYRKLGKVQYFGDKLTMYTNNDKFLILCRSSGAGSCSNIFENESLKFRTSFVKLWRFHFPFYSELRLYELKEAYNTLLLPKAGNSTFSAH